MFRLNTVQPEQASGQVAEAYGVFPPQVGVPAPMIMMSASPALALLQSKIMQHFIKHPNLGFKLQALIRYLVAADQGYAFCVGFNGDMLKQTGLSDLDLEAIQDDPNQAPLDDKDKALLGFVLKALRTPEEVQDADLAMLRGLGWSDSDIFDALWIGGGMLAPSRLFRALAGF